MTMLLTPRAHASTSALPLLQRLPFWESHHASELIGLKCSTYDPEGLDASSQIYDLGVVSLTEIRGNQHMVERTPCLLKSHPKDSIFACILLQGDAFLFQSGQYQVIHAGDIVIYSNMLPYLYGFTEDMHQIIVEIGLAQLADGHSGLMPSAPLLIDHRLRSGRYVARFMTQAVRDFIRVPQASAALGVAAHIRSLMRASLDPHFARDLNDTSAWRLMRADAYIEEHLQDPDLNADKVAQALGLSVRQLYRLFAQDQRSVTQWIQSQRLRRARDEIGYSYTRRLSVGDIADRWAFTSQAHFSRVFKGMFGVTPMEHRREMSRARSPT